MSAPRPHPVVETPVLIAGGGPAGLAAAIALARGGVDSLVVERRPLPPQIPKATTVSIRTMELLRLWGLEERASAGGHDVDWLCWESPTLAEAGAGRAVPLGVPSREQSALVSPTSPGAIPQDHLEPLMERHLAELGRTEVARGTELTGLLVTDDGVEAELRGPDGSARTVRARWLIGADGGRSIVRERLGIGMRESGELHDAVSAIFHGPLWELVGGHHYGMYSLAEGGPRGIFLPSGGDRWVYGLMLPPGGPRADEVGADEMARQIVAGVGVPGWEPAIERLGRFPFAAGIAESFGGGRAFLVGDAAHRVTPRGGTGMNMAIQGGQDLGWKLAWVERGWSGPRILESYERERRPLAEHNIAKSIDPEAAKRDANQEIHADLGGRIPHVWTRSGGERRSTLDLPTVGLSLLTARPERWAPAAAQVTAPPVAVRDVEPLAARGLGLIADGALLVRPDGLPAAWLMAAEDPAAALRASVAAMLGSESRRVRPRA